MERVAASSGLTLGSDIVGFASGDEMAGFLFDGLASRQVEAAVTFNASSLDLAAGIAEYELWFNQSERRYRAGAGLLHTRCFVRVVYSPPTGTTLAPPFPLLQPASRTALRTVRTRPG